jgi:hypothetical protein
MSELTEEDVIGGCIRAPVVGAESYRSPNLAILSLVYSNSSEAKDITR